MKARKTESEKAQALEISTPKPRMVVTLDRGPRIAFLGRPDGENLFYWQVDDKGKDDWRLLGGNQQ